MMPELKFDNTKEVFKLDKEILSFKLDINNLSELEPIKQPITSETEIKITNLTDDYLIFRTKTTKKLYYRVQPTFCTLSPKEIKNIKIIFNLKEGEKPKFNGHKFRFEGFVIQENEKDIEPKILFHEYTQKGATVVGNSQKTFVQFSDSDENTIGNKKIKHTKSGKHLELPTFSHARSSSDVSEYVETEENIENENEKENENKGLLLDKIKLKDDQEVTLSEIITGENKIETSIENKDIAKDEIKEEEKKNIIEESNGLNNIEKKEQIEELKKENIRPNENTCIYEKIEPEKKTMNYNNIENNNNISDIKTYLALFILMIIGYYLVK